MWSEKPFLAHTVSVLAGSGHFRDGVDWESRATQGWVSGVALGSLVLSRQSSKGEE